MSSKLNLMRIFAGALALVALGGFSGAFAQEAAPMHPAGVAKVQGFVSREPVVQGSRFEVAVVADVPSAYHMNAHKVSDEYLIPTTVTADLPAGIQQTEIVYPEGTQKKFSFSKDPLNVYEGRVVIRLKLSAGADAKKGEMEIPLTLHYQACNDSTCFPPVRVPVTIPIQIAAAGTASHAVHPEIFSAK